MNKRSNLPVRPTWCWRRWIVSGQEDLWIERLQSHADINWVMTEKPGCVRILLEAYARKPAAVTALAHTFGGKVRRVQAAEWVGTQTAAPTRIGTHLEIIHAPTRTRQPTTHRLCIPHGVAFGSGDHATTHMLLGALFKHGDWSHTSVLDLGTGSGVLALAARLLGAHKIVATDFDPEAVRTARQNETLNFSTPLIRWQCADVKKLRSPARHDLVLANLFSGILGEAAPQIAGSVAIGGQLWLSGILRTQEQEVTAAYRAQKLTLTRALHRGKWVMLQWQKKLKSRRAIST